MRRLLSVRTTCMFTGEPPTDTNRGNASRIVAHYSCARARSRITNRFKSDSGKFRMPSPVLGSLAIQAPAPTQTVHVSPQTCHNISLFKGPVGLAVTILIVDVLSESVPRSNEGIPET